MKKSLILVLRAALLYSDPRMAVKIHLEKKTITLSVGDLVAEPVAPAQRVAGLRQWTRLALGREAHTTHQRAQDATYRKEFFVRHELTVDGFAVKIQGRIDGVQPVADAPWIVEEIKSLVVSPMMWAALDVHSHPHHLEQLGMYCHLLEHGGQAVRGRLVYVNVVDGARRQFDVAGPFTKFGVTITERIRALLTHALERERSRFERRQRGAALVFPHAQPRRYQEELMAQVAGTLEHGRHLLVSAPSGIGKTVGTLFPALKFALAHDQRVFFVTAKNTQHAQAAATLRRLATASGVVIQAREKMCINSIYACREEFCAHLQMLPLKVQQTGIVARLAEKRVLEAPDTIAAGRAVSVCPFELALLEAERLDAVVGDYNYVFDPQVYFRRFFQDADYSDAILIIDEAHNLVARALDYYSPRLSRHQVHDAGRQLGHIEPGLAKQIRGLLRVIDEFLAAQQPPAADEYSQVEDEPPPPTAGRQFLIESPQWFFDEIRPQVDRLSVRYFLDKVESGRALPEDPLEDFFSELGKFYSVLGLAGEEFAYLADGESVQVLCRDASRMLAERLAGFHSVIAMSATLEPMDFYATMLGFDAARTDRLCLPSPFPAENRKVLVYHRVSTAFRHRGANYEKIAEIIATTTGARPGNYMALFPSYEFLRATARHLTPPFLAQEPGMTDEQRAAVLSALQTNDPPKLVLAVQGGVFAEGVDYPGEMLSGVIVVSPALPTVSFERELMRRYYQERYGKGFEFAYLYPGMNRVIQSVGRLIRTETDVGVAVLICQRFAQNQYTALFPAEWSNVGMIQLISKDLPTELADFWAMRPSGKPLYTGASVDIMPTT
jgi:DNA excision repair protein ERCC-2